MHILLFVRTSCENLQQKALQNRSHHRFVLAFNLQTTGHVHVNHVVLPFHPGQALIIHPYQFHHFSQLQSQELEWLFCTFELEPGGFLEPLRNQVLDIGPETVNARERLLTEWFRSSDPGWQGDLQDVQLQTVLMRLLLCLRRDGTSSMAGALPESSHSLIRSINRLMTEWEKPPISVAKLAGELSMSESRLRAVFKETSGIPLGRYIHNYRINRAMALLRTSTRAIADVAEQAGYSSPQAFSRNFKAETGQSPLSYRRQSGTSTTMPTGA